MTVGVDEWRTWNQDPGGSILPLQARSQLHTFFSPGSASRLVNESPPLVELSIFVFEVPSPNLLDSGTLGTSHHRGSL